MALKKHKKTTPKPKIFQSSDPFFMCFEGKKKHLILIPFIILNHWTQK